VSFFATVVAPLEAYKLGANISYYNSPHVISKPSINNKHHTRAIKTYETPRLDYPDTHNEAPPRGSGTMS